MIDLAKWCQDNNLFLNIIKTDYRRSTEEENVAPNVVTEDLTWSDNTTQLVKKSHQHLHFLRRLRKFGMLSRVLGCFYRCGIESVLTSSITVWFGNCTVQDHKALQQVFKPSLELPYQHWKVFARLESSGEPEISSRTIIVPTQPFHTPTIRQTLQEC